MAYGTATLTIPIIDNLDEDGDGGRIKVALQENSSVGYKIAGSGSAYVTITDTDDHNATGFTVAGQVILDILREQSTSPGESGHTETLQLPTVSIAAEPGQLKGAGLRFSACQHPFQQERH